jgi:N-acetylmuramoyl-L-alanine amidase
MKSNTLRRAIGVMVFMVAPGLASQPKMRNHVVIFSGHTTSEAKRGALSSAGIHENEYNDAVVNLLQPADGISYNKVFSSEGVNLRQRLRYDLDAKLYVEVHHDAVASRHIQDNINHYLGYSIFFSGNKFSEENFVLAELVGNRLSVFLRPDTYHHLFQGMNLVDSHRGIYQRNLFVNRHAIVPSILIECGYIHTKSAEENNGPSDRTQRVARSIDQAIHEYFSRQSLGF